MRVMVIVKASKSSEAGELPSTELMTAMGAYNEELVAAGIILAGEGLKPSAKGVRVHFSGANREVIDGPFTETKELIAGFWLWKVKSMEEAIQWVKRCPNPMMEPSDIEIRPVFEAEDFGEAFTPELREQEATLRAKGHGLPVPEYLTGPELLIAGESQSYDSNTRSSIPNQWAKFAPHLGKVPGQVGKNSYGVCWNATPDCRFDYLTGVAVSSPEGLPAGFKSLKLDPRRYAVFKHQGDVSTLPATIDTIWSRWAPESGLKIAKNAPGFERYTEEFDPEKKAGGIELWIPLENEA